MEKQKFDIGEKVALKSILRPDLNTARTTVTNSAYRENGTCGVLGLPYTGWVYTVSSNKKSWCESALRKVPGKDSEDFDRMMTKLKRRIRIVRPKPGIIEIKREEEPIIESN